MAEEAEAEDAVDLEEEAEAVVEVVVAEEVSVAGEGKTDFIVLWMAVGIAEKRPLD